MKLSYTSYAFRTNSQKWFDHGNIEPQTEQLGRSNIFVQKVNLSSHMFCQHNWSAHVDDLCVKLASLKRGIDEVLIAKTSLGERSQEIHL